MAIFTNKILKRERKQSNSEDNILKIPVNESVKMIFRRLLPFFGILLWITISYAFEKYETAVNLPSYFHSLNNKQENVFPTKLVDFKFAITSQEIESSLSFANLTVDRLKMLENNIDSAKVRVHQGTPSHGMLINNEPRDEALAYDKNSLISSKMTLHVLNSHCVREQHRIQECALFITQKSLFSTQISNGCEQYFYECTPDTEIQKYRSIDGLCNNPKKSYYGKTFTPYRRLLFPLYRDGVQEPRRSENRMKLPSARDVSLRLGKSANVPDRKVTLAFMQWSQFVEHDLSHTVSKKKTAMSTTIDCCDPSGRKLSPRHLHPSCLEINVSPSDPFYSDHFVTCMSYVRSVTVMGPKCNLGPVEQMNQATHFLDGSHIYGSTPDVAKSVRMMQGGFLTTDDNEYLPPSKDPLRNCQVNSTSAPCYLGADSRVNIHPYLTTMHTLWVREHNRLAYILGQLNPHWDDETLYQEAKRIVVAEIQHITYDHWKPILLGTNIDVKVETELQFSETTDPSVSNSFATAAIRFYNSLMDSSIRLYSEDRTNNKTLPLRDYFNRPLEMSENDMLDSLIRSLSTQLSQASDMNYAEDLTKYLFQHDSFGYDILSLDIQRGRDHGLPGYNFYRKLCGLPRASKFSDFQDVISQDVIKQLENLYEHVDDVDLMIGGLAEKSKDDSLLGHTFTCLFSEQLIRTRQGDRFFYTHNDQMARFSRKQLAEIKKTSLARIFCDNSDGITKMQINVFHKVSRMNDLVLCSGDEIPKMNLDHWKDSKNKYKYMHINSQ